METPAEASEGRTARLNALLRALLRARRQPSSPAPVSAAEAMALVDQARAEGVAPLLYARVHGRAVLPSAAEERLRLAYLANAARNFFLLRELERALLALSIQDIPVLLLKGAALGPAVYGNPALRPMGDLDLLVRPADAPCALETLASIGYRPVRPPLRPATLTTDESQVFLRHGEVNLELHWGLLDFPQYAHHLPMEKIWAGACPISIGTARAWMLNAEDQILYLCAHLMLHHGEGRPRLLWLHDIAEVIVHAGEQLDWAAILERAGAYDLLLPLQRVLPHLAEEWQAPIPPAVLERLRKAHPSSAENLLHFRLAAHRRSVARRFWDHLAGRPTWSGRLRFAWDNLFPSPAYMRERYAIRHPFLLPFYYPYRWLRGLRSALSPKP
ncbi:MAG: nucleotidyltransferase domain-containing protein [Chloroflexia bacterium]